MPYACSYEVPADEELYLRCKAAIGDTQPAGLITHLVTRTDGGLRHTSVWESQAQWERYRDHHVRPAVAQVLAAVGMTGPPPRPVETELAVVDVLVGS
jgi:hypothetical protein